MGVGEVNYCLESGLNLLFGSSGTEGSMKGRRSEVGCCHTVIRGKEGGVAFFFAEGYVLRGHVPFAYPVKIYSVMMKD